MIHCHRDTLHHFLRLYRQLNRKYLDKQSEHDEILVSYLQSYRACQNHFLFRPRNYINTSFSYKFRAKRKKPEFLSLVIKFFNQRFSAKLQEFSARIHMPPTQSPRQITMHLSPIQSSDRPLPNLITQMESMNTLIHCKLIVDKKIKMKICTFYKMLGPEHNKISKLSE